MKGSYCSLSLVDGRLEGEWGPAKSQKKTRFSNSGSWPKGTGSVPRQRESSINYLLLAETEILRWAPPLRRAGRARRKSRSTLDHDIDQPAALPRRVLLIGSIFADVRSRQLASFGQTCHPMPNLTSHYHL